MESCCDYITIYDGNGMRSPKLVQLGGPNATVTTPTGLYTTSQRFALVTFQSDPVIQKTGFQFIYQSVFSEFPIHWEGVHLVKLHRNRDNPKVILEVNEF
ncbi:unnamed protein product [Haemonchus placei]|uniref:CUB domain-containing protein n=1 Tax=Haemonchus placei TaxID=6290 RepID=A0A0N4VWJ1_HAEPC|nr:unnamed protein product [Haemonchus placei]